MRILHKLLIGVCAPAILIWVLGFHAATASEDHLRHEIERDLRSQAQTLVDEIDRAAAQHLYVWRRFGRDPDVLDALRDANAWSAARPRWPL